MTANSTHSHADALQFVAATALVALPALALDASTRMHARIGCDAAQQYGKLPNKSAMRDAQKMSQDATVAKRGKAFHKRRYIKMNGSSRSSRTSSGRS
jgi:hypothetical protein